MASGHDVRTVLVVDDEDRLRNALARAFVLEGHRVKCAASGEEAVALFRDEGADVVVTDLVMPGISGIRLIEEIQRIKPGVQSILITAYGTAENRREADHLGVAAYLSKPFNLVDLKARVNSLLRSASDDEPGAAYQWRVLRSLCASAGRTLGMVVRVSRRAVRCLNPAGIPLAAGKAAAAPASLLTGMRGLASAIMKAR